MEARLRKVRKAPSPATIRVCINEYQEDGSDSCGPRGGKEMRALLEKGIEERNIDIQFRALEGLGLCQRGPSVMLDPGNSFFLNAQPEDVPEILDHVEKFVAEVKALRGE
mgnify:FL=1